MRNHPALRLAGLVLVALAGAAPSAPAAAAAAADDGAAQSPGEPQGAWDGFWREHGWHLLTALGIDQAAKIYDRSVGPSVDPLIFDDPPGIDEWFHDRASSSTRLHGYIENYGLETLRYGTPIGLVILDWGHGRMMVRDVMGAIETYHTNRGLTTLFKDVFGRERPELEYADPDSMTPQEYDEIANDDHNHESFPSGHASGSFAFASYLERAIAREIGMNSTARYFSFAGLYGVAGYIGWSRVNRSKHFFTDVVAGAAQGVFVARTWYRLNHPDEYPKRARRAAWLRLYPPEFFPGGAAVSIGIRIDPPSAAPVSP